MMTRPLPVRWTGSGRISMLRKGEVQVWRSPIESESWLAGCRRLLDNGEKERERTFLREADRARYSAGRGLLRWFIGAQTGLDPHQVVLHVNSHGKPLLRTPHDTLMFNVTHAEQMVLCAFSLGAGIGVDVEYEREFESLHEIAERSYSAGEREWLFAGHAGERLTRFYNLWTRKEALLKAHGGGLSGDPATVDVMGGSSKAHSGTSYTLLSFIPSPGYSGALAMEAGPTEVVFLEPAITAPDESDQARET